MKYCTSVILVMVGNILQAEHFHGEAESLNEALGYAVQTVQEKYPDGVIFKTAIFDITDDVQRFHNQHTERLT